MSEVIVITSGKGGVGKTTTTANLGTGLAKLDKKVVMIDTDIGLRNLDVVMGLENRIVYTLVDVIEYTEEYIKKIITGYELTCNTNTQIEDGIIKVTIDTNHNSILIGKNGKTLQALNDVCRYAVAAKFKKHYRILLDINSYKNEKYAKLTRIAKRVAKEVLNTKATVHLDPMPADERRIVHNALTKFKNVSTQSEGVGNKRHIVISYKD